MADDRVQTEAGPLVPLRLVPVEVFGAEDGYGLCDAVSAWSDCNRADGHIYRVDDGDPQYREPGQTVEIFVREADLPFFAKAWGDEPEASKVPADTQAQAAAWDAAMAWLSTRAGFALVQAGFAANPYAATQEAPRG